MTLHDDLAAARLPWTSPRLQRWYSPGHLHAQLRTGTETAAAWVGDADFGSTFRDNVACVAVADPLAWANRRLDLGDGDWAVTGIRYRGLDIDRPFVDVVATSLPPTTAALARLADVVLPQYADFAPRALRVDAPDPDALVAALADGPLRAVVDQYVVAGLVSDLRAAPRRPDFDRMTLHRRDDVDAVTPEVEALYTELLTQRPDLAEWAHAGHHDELAECAEQHLLLEVRCDGEPAGFVAATRRDEHALTGFVVVEIVLGATARGRGLARAVLQRLADELPAGDGDTLWGTIHPDNLPSRRNAASVGREVVGGYVWVLPQGSPGV